MLNMSKHGKTQNLVLIGVQKNEKKKNTIEAFYQTPGVLTLFTYDEQCMNVLKSCLNTCYNAT